jgi:hypothetical protein
VNPDSSVQGDPSKRESILGQSAGLALACAPLGFDWLWKMAVEPRPYWVFYYDPELLYFFKGLELLRGVVAMHLEHPGVPVQLLSAALAAALDSSPTNVEPFLLAANILALLLTIGAIALLWRTLLAGLPWPLRIAGVWLIFLAPAALGYVAVWSPEALYLPIGALAVAAVARLAAHGTDGSGPRPAILLGAATGLAVSLKFTFLAWVPAGAAAVVTAAAGSGRRKAARAALFGAAALGAFALVASHMLPRAGEHAAWLWRLVSRTGAYGEGAAGLPSFADWFDPLVAYLWASKKWHVVLLALVGFAGWLLWPRTGPGRDSRSERPLAIFVLLAWIGAHVLASRWPEPRYLLTHALLAPFAVRFAARCVPRLHRPRSARLLLAVTALLVVRQVSRDLDRHRQRIAGATEVAAELERAVARLAPASSRPVVVYGYRAPRPSFALHAFARLADEHEAIFRRYPDDGYMNSDGTVHLPPGRAACHLLVLAEARPAEPDLAITESLARVGDFVVVAPRTP